MRPTYKFITAISAEETERLIDPQPESRREYAPYVALLAAVWIGAITAGVYLGLHSSSSRSSTRELFMGAYTNDSAVFQGQRLYVFASGCAKTTIMHFWEPGGQYYGSKPASLTSFCTSAFTPCSASKGCDWPVSVSLDLPLNATAGVWKASYDIHGKNASEAGAERAVSFAVLAHSPTSSAVNVIPVYTYSAYNFYGGMSFYLSPHVNGKTYDNETEFLDNLSPDDDIHYTTRSSRTVLSMNRPYLYSEVYPKADEIGKASRIDWKMTWGSFPNTVIPESHLLTHRDWLCQHFSEIRIHAKNEYVDVGETLALLNCSSSVTLHVSSFEYAFHHVNYTQDTLTFSWDAWKEGAFRLDRDVFGGSNEFTGHRNVLFCLQNSYGDCSYVRTMGPVEGLPDHTIPTGNQRMVVQPNDFEKFGYAPKNSKLRFSFNRTDAQSEWTYTGVEFDKLTHKMANPPVVASVMVNTQDGTIKMGAVCPDAVCPQALVCNCTAYAPTQSFFDGRPTNKANFYYFP